MIKNIETKNNEVNLFDILLKKEVRCRHCDSLLEKETGLVCDCGSYREQDWYCKFKRKANGIINLWDYFEFHINPTEVDTKEAIRIAEYELMDRK